MKLDTWKMKSFAKELNSRLPDDLKWPRLELILEETEESIPLKSSANSGSGIHVGWMESDYSWYYHHSICLPSISSGSGQVIYGFHGHHSASKPLPARLYPIFNVGDLPESQLFVKILNKHGICASLADGSMSKIRFKE